MPAREYHIQAAPGLWPPTWPMGLTMLRMMLLPVFLWAMLAHGRGSAHPRVWLPIGIFGVMALTDKLDGYLARKLRQTSKLGAILDPVADKVLVTCSVILLSFEHIAGPGVTVPWWVIVAVYGKDLITALGVTLLMAFTGKVVIAARTLGKLSTFFQLSMVMAVLVAPALGSARAAGWASFVHGLFWAVTALAALACVDYVHVGFGQFGQWRATRADETRRHEDTEKKT